jgi:sec-independent protein translocase protein TatA
MQMLGGLSLFHWIIVLALALLLFGGKNKISDLMGDVAKGIKSFKKGMSEDDAANAAPTAPAEPARTLDRQATPSPVETPADIRKAG